MRDYLFFLLFFLLAISCNSSKKETNSVKQNAFVFPENKIWAHRVNSFEEVEKKHSLFEGLEIDIFYSKFLKDFYVAHDEIDTLKETMLDDWLRHIPNPEKNWYWLDLKNLEKKNAEEIALRLVNILSKYGILDKTLCENRDVKALSALKRKGLAVSYWVKSDEFLRKIAGKGVWQRKVRKNITFLKPDALSAFSWMHPLLDTSFPEQNILYWYTPEEYHPEDVEFVNQLQNISNVKAVLVSYRDPYQYEQ